MDFILGLLSLFGIILIIIIVNYLTKSDTTVTIPPCKKHNWQYTGKEPGTFKVLKCTVCNFVAGEHDEYGRQNSDNE